MDRTMVIRKALLYLWIMKLATATMHKNDCIDQLCGTYLSSHPAESPGDSPGAQCLYSTRKYFSYLKKIIVQSKLKLNITRICSNRRKLSDLAKQKVAQIRVKRQVKELDDSPTTKTFELTRTQKAWETDKKSTYDAMSTQLVAYTDMATNISDIYTEKSTADVILKDISTLFEDSKIDKINFGIDEDGNNTVDVNSDDSVFANFVETVDDIDVRPQISPGDAEFIEVEDPKIIFDVDYTGDSLTGIDLGGEYFDFRSALDVKSVENDKRLRQDSLFNNDTLFSNETEQTTITKNLTSVSQDTDKSDNNHVQIPETGISSDALLIGTVTNASEEMLFSTTVIDSSDTTVDPPTNTSDTPLMDSTTRFVQILASTVTNSENISFTEDAFLGTTDQLDIEATSPVVELTNVVDEAAISRDPTLSIDIADVNYTTSYLNNITKVTELEHYTDVIVTPVTTPDGVTVTTIVSDSELSSTQSAIVLTPSTSDSFKENTSVQILFINNTTLEYYTDQSSFTNVDGIPDATNETYDGSTVISNDVTIDLDISGDFMQESLTPVLGGPTLSHLINESLILFNTTINFSGITDSISDSNIAEQLIANTTMLQPTNSTYPSVTNNISTNIINTTEGHSIIFNTSATGVDNIVTTLDSSLAAVDNIPTTVVPDSITTSFEEISTSISTLSSNIPTSVDINIDDSTQASTTLRITTQEPSGTSSKSIPKTTSDSHRSTSGAAGRGGDVASEEAEDETFWPVVLALVVGIPAVIVFGIAITVIHKKRKIDTRHAFYLSPPRPEIDV